MANLFRPLVCGSLRRQTFLALKASSTNCPHRFTPLSTGPIINRTRYSTKQEDLESLSTEQGELVYKGRIGNLFRVLKVFSLTTSSVGLAVQPYLIVTFSDMSMLAAAPLFGAINFFVILNPLLIHYVAKKYVSELYFNPQSGMFTAVMLTFFARRMHFTFKAEDVKVPDVPTPFAMLTAKGKPLFVQEEDFDNMTVYKHLMRFDEPLNLLTPKKEHKID